jgi:hypothetical protein
LRVDGVWQQYLPGPTVAAIGWETSAAAAEEEAASLEAALLRRASLMRSKSAALEAAPPLPPPPQPNSPRAWPIPPIALASPTGCTDLRPIAPNPPVVSAACGTPNASAVLATRPCKLFSAAADDANRAPP